MRWLGVLLPLWLAAALGGCKTGLPKGEPDTLLAEGKRHYEAKEYSDATRYFRAVKERHPEAEEAEEGRFLLAEARRHRGHGQRAFEAYKKFIETYPNSRYAVGVALGEYRLGLDHLEGKVPGFWIFKADRAYGVRILEHMQINFRNHSLADDALMRVSDYHLKERDYEDATMVLRRLLAEYPRSEHMLWARFQLARSLWLQNQGPAYDERLLENSRRAFEDYVGTARLAGMAQKQAKQIEAAGRMIARIDGRRAEKEYVIGRFYERTRHPGAAVYYYRHCIRTFPQTEHAEASRKRLARLEAREEPAPPAKAPAPKKGEKK
ncbi:MAG: outer membrane protein assembly factor BamD [Planctomycetota bacterium]|jgi:outer membrane protein assembly factor BamD (BamD/ComL family)